MGIAESVLGGEEADFDAEFGEEGAWLGEDGEGSQAQSTPRTVVDADAEARQLPDRGLRVMSVEFGSPAATGRVVAFGSERAAALAGPHHRGLITFTDIILSANGVECVRARRAASLPVRRAGQLPRRLACCRLFLALRRRAPALLQLRRPLTTVAPPLPCVPLLLHSDVRRATTARNSFASSAPS